MIRGVGVDLLSIERMAGRAAQERFMARVFSGREREELARCGNKAETLAGRFCAKEAVSKALGIALTMHDLPCIIIDGMQGQPQVVLTGHVKEQFDRAGGGRIHVSITHERGRAAAFAVWETED